MMKQTSYTIPLQTNDYSKYPYMDLSKHFFKSITFTHTLICFNTVCILVLILTLLWKKAGFEQAAQQTNTNNVQIYCPIQEQTCIIKTEQGVIELSVAVPIQPLVPFTVTLKSADIAISEAKLRFEGLDEYMGINQFRFETSADDSQTWQLQGSIPVCTIVSKTWRVTLNIQNQLDNSYKSYWFTLKII
ncbi:MAG: hypothetical protein ACI9ES_000357 [Oceanospirillaceae bacterium]|jgi:hypothetical protein